MTDKILQFLQVGECKCPKCGKEATLFPFFSNDSDKLLVEGRCFVCEHEFKIEYVPVFLSKGETPDAVTPVYWREGEDGHTRTAVVITGSKEEGSVDFVNGKGDVLFRLDVIWDTPGEYPGAIFSANPEGNVDLHDVVPMKFNKDSKVFQIEFK